MWFGKILYFIAIRLGNGLGVKELDIEEPKHILQLITHTTESVIKIPI